MSPGDINDPTPAGVADWSDGSDRLAAESVQNFGWLIGADPRGDRIIFASENAGAYLGCETSDLIGAPIEARLDPELVHDIRNVAGRGSSAIRPELVARRRFGDVLADDLVHTTDEAIVIEFMAATAALEKGDELAAKIRRLPYDVREETDVAGLLRQACVSLHRIVAPRQTLVFEFLGDGLCAVAAEASRQRDASYLGALLQASALPQSTRKAAVGGLQFFGGSPERQSPVTWEKGAQAPDLGLALLHGQPMAALEALEPLAPENMIACGLFPNGKLWGVLTLIDVDNALFNAAGVESLDLLSRSLSLEIGRIQLESRLAASRRAGRAAMRLAAAGRSDAALKTAADELAGALKAKAAAIIDSEGAVAAGSGAPPAIACRDIARAAMTPGATEPRIIENREAVASGHSALALPLGDDILLAFRPFETATWLDPTFAEVGVGAGVWRRDDLEIAQLVVDLFLETPTIA